jgi:hypothetical protein
MIEQLTEKNLSYELKINELREAINDLDTMNEVNNQLAESAREEENELRQSLDMAEMRIREAKAFLLINLFFLSEIILI